MTDDASNLNPPAPAPDAPQPAKPARKPPTAAEFFAALGNQVRWAAVKLMADGQEVSAIQVAKALGRDFDMVSKHLRILRRVGAVRWKRGEDERVNCISSRQKIGRSRACCGMAGSKSSSARRSEAPMSTAAISAGSGWTARRTAQLDDGLAHVRT